MNETTTEAVFDGEGGLVEWERYRRLVRSWLEVPGYEVHEGLPAAELAMDQAYVLADPETDVGVYRLSDDCFRCPYELVKYLRGGARGWWTEDTARGATWRLYPARDQYISAANTENMICQLRPELGEFGVYRLNVTGRDCQLITEQEPVDIYMPLYLLLCVLGGVALLYSIGALLAARLRRSGKLRYGDKELQMQQRLRALDAFRGIAIVLMIFVNDGAGGYWWLGHATWNGLLVGDLVFPAFLWIMGVCIPLSTKGAFAKGIPRWKILVHVVRRSCVMFLLGVALNSASGAALGSLRVMGVLQRLAVSYLVAAGFYAMTAKKYFTPSRVSGACGQACKDVLSCAYSWALAGVLLVAHTVITFVLHEPGCPAGYLGPGGKHLEWAAANCSGGAAGAADRLLLGAAHMYQGGARSVYGGLVTEPEGLLGCLTSIVQTLLGVQAGATVLLQRSHTSRVARWLAWALVFALTGALLAGFSKEHGIVPINKNLWSISFVFVTTSINLVILSLCYVLTDAWHAWGGGPVRAPGLNALALYVGSQLCYQLFPFHWRVENMNTHAVVLLEAAWGTALWLIVAHLLARKKVFITL
ncbi:unnamed protein product [Plutella xylostella]|uniref:(diamondback moth) hypothetical protein n=1 Tax=Plutella xylostella TaxID=51655 RepID=A0A8S4D2W9_PLUXY|nr:unnamed protein product [Plutella xylostella]